jgi:hypothetical protein
LLQVGFVHANDGSTAVAFSVQELNERTPVTRGFLLPETGETGVFRPETGRS